MLETSQECINVMVNKKSNNSVEKEIVKGSLNKMMQYIVTVAQWNHNQSTSLAGAIFAASILLIFNDFVDERTINPKESLKVQRNFMWFAKIIACVYIMLMSCGFLYQMRKLRLLLEDKLLKKQENLSVDLSNPSSATACYRMQTFIQALEVDSVINFAKTVTSSEINFLRHTMVTSQPISQVSDNKEEDNEIQFKVNDGIIRFAMFADPDQTKFYIKQQTLRDESVEAVKEKVYVLETGEQDVLIVTLYVVKCLNQDAEVAEFQAVRNEFNRLFKYPRFDKINHLKLDQILEQIKTYQQVGRAQPSFLRQQFVASSIGDKVGDPPGINEDGLHTPPRKEESTIKKHHKRHWS